MYYENLMKFKKMSIKSFYHLFIIKFKYFVYYEKCNRNRDNFTFLHFYNLQNGKMGI